MAYVSFRTDAVHATTTTQPQRKLAWGRLFALATTLAMWAGIIAAARVIF